ncbi:MAG: serine/threonine-protein kinase, partial [Burkholderiales bacterium]
MKLSAEQLATLSRLSDEWLDLPPSQRALWREEAIRQHPALAEAIAAMADDSSDSGMFPELTRVPRDHADEAAAFVAGAVLGPYRLVREIGVGGMGVVWLADQVDGHVSRTVALKLPLHHFAQQGLRTRFARERNILAALDHPNIAKLLDAGVTEAGQPYMAMQYVPGIAITAYCDKQNLDINARLKLFIELLQAVQHAHSNLVVHRDLKPGNILVTDDNRVMLLDFGIAKLLNIDTPDLSVDADTPMTEFAGSALTLDYASPEQVSGKPISTRSDIYSLGIVLYELLVGARPYRLRRSSKAALEEAVLSQDIQLPSSRAREIDAKNPHPGRGKFAKTFRGDLDAIVRKALHKEPEGRYATAQAFADDLQRWLRREPVSAQPDKFGYRVSRFLARYRQLIAVSSAVALALIVTTSVAVMQAIEAKHAAQAAQEETRKAQAVTTFLKDLFNTNTLNQIDPAAARKRTAEQLLNDGAKRIKDSLKDAPEQQIELLHTMVDLYYGMPSGDEMRLDLAKRSIDVAKAAFGEDSPQTIEEIARMANVAFGLQNEKEGLAALKLVQPRLKEFSSSSDKQLLKVAGRILDAQLNHESSLLIARQAESVYLSLPPHDFDYKRRWALARAYFNNFNFEDAERELIEATRLAEISGEQDNAELPLQYGRLLSMIGRYAEADVKFNAALAMERRSDDFLNDQFNDYVLELYARYLTSTSRAELAWLLATTGATTRSLQAVAPKAFADRFLLAKGRTLMSVGQIEKGLALINDWKKQMIAAHDSELATRFLLNDLIEVSIEFGRLLDTERDLDGLFKVLSKEDAVDTVGGQAFWRQKVTLHIAQR